MVLVAIWLIINSVKIREVIQGRGKFNFATLPNAKTFKPESG